MPPVPDAARAREPPMSGGTAAGGPCCPRGAPPEVEPSAPRRPWACATLAAFVAKSRQPHPRRSPPRHEGGPGSRRGGRSPCRDVSAASDPARAGGRSDSNRTRPRGTPCGPPSCPCHRPPATRTKPSGPCWDHRMGPFSATGDCRDGRGARTGAPQSRPGGWCPAHSSAAPAARGAHRRPVAADQIQDPQATNSQPELEACG